MKALQYALSMVAAVAMVACQGKTSVDMKTSGGAGSGDVPTVPNMGGGDGSGGGGGGGGGGTGLTCNTGRGYTGFGAMDLTADRSSADIGLDRDLLKPYSALVGEYPRVLGNTPALIPTMAATFSDPAARWYQVQKSNAVAVFSAFRVAFEGCLDITATDAKYAAAPDGNSAPANCRDFQTNFWNRAPSNDETAACTMFAVTQTTTETNPRRQWAYACASVLTAAQFLGY